MNAVLLDLWEYLTRTFKLNEIHADDDVILKVDGELLTLTLSSGNTYDTVEFIESYSGENLNILSKV